MRKSGILCHLSSLPNPYGIGSYGQSAFDFIDFLVETKQSLWQILPLGPTSFGNSPYQSFSVFAHNPYFIDIDLLIVEGSLDAKETKLAKKRKKKVDYGHLYETRMPLLRMAFSRFEPTEEYQTFILKEASWLDDYALFMAIKKAFKDQSWLYWDEDIRMRQPEALNTYQEKYREEIAFHQFLQFKAYQQWQKLKRHANARGIEIVGDMPIYVAYDSSDVWAHPELFLLDEKRIPTDVAGVPPDRFTGEGQLWGNPLYNWQILEKQNYAWWLHRVRHALSLYDHIRIDHFIGFVRFYRVPYGAKTAEHGVWAQGPGESFFNTLKEELGDVNIIAEDLGVLTEDVRTLLKTTGYPGMKVFQFGFSDQKENEYQPHLYPIHTIAYTGTHDNQTTRSWFRNLDRKNRSYVRSYVRAKIGLPISEQIIWATLQSAAETVIIPLQDYLNLTDRARMNRPATVGKNWQWRFIKRDLTKSLRHKVKWLTTLSGRARID